MPGQSFVLAVKRDKRETVPADWVSRVRQTAGVTIVGAASAARLQVTATPQGLGELQRELAEFVYIEPIILHKRS
jgi:hypothetical protein